MFRLDVEQKLPVSVGSWFLQWILRTHIFRTVSPFHEVQQ